MRIVLFCENLYSLSILRPIDSQARAGSGNTVLWYMHSANIPQDQIPEDINWTYSMQETYDFSPEAIFVPGNIVPYYLPGVKIQIFHGYAAEKKGHYVMRKYFDLYLTQGPLYTAGFEALALKHGDFEVVQTGWSKRDLFASGSDNYSAERDSLKAKYGKENIVLYAPTFSPKLTSLTSIKSELQDLIEQRNVLLVIKLHPLTSALLVEEYEQFAAENSQSVIFERGGDGLQRYLFLADIMISDTSSVVYEFILMGKPVITLNSIALEIYWHNITQPEQLLPTFDEVSRGELGSNEIYTKAREMLDPYTDGLSSQRMLDAAADYIKRHGVPRLRKVNLWRRYTSVKRFGKIKK